jgi:hypothetical protein
MGGTGLEPVTPSLSTRQEALCLVALDAGCFMLKGPFSAVLRQRTGVFWKRAESRLLRVQALDRH